MTFQTGTTASSNARRDALTKLVALATSKHISAVVLNAAGTGYTVGDILTIAHAGGYHSAKLEVLTIGGGGAVATVKIRSGGAFSNRVATVAKNAGGSGYAVGDIVRLTTGTFTEFCKVKVDTISGSAAATVSIFETGGAYTSAPTATGGATNSDIGTGSGTGLTIDTTMTGLIGTTGAATTGGTGTGATFDLTLTDTGWSATTAAQNRNDYSFNGINDEKEVILQGTVAGGDEPYVGIRTYTATSGINTRHGWIIVGMDSFNSSLGFTAQPNVGPTPDPAANTGCCFLMFDDAQSFWMSVNGRRMITVIKAVGVSTTAYTTMYAGLLDPFGTQTENPYPMYLSGSTSSHNRAPDGGGFTVTGPTELFADTSTTCPVFFRTSSDGSWQRCLHSNNGTLSQLHIVYPLGNTQQTVGGIEDESAILGQFNYQMGSAGAGVSQVGGGVASQVVMPTITDGNHGLIPTVVISSPTSGDNNSETQIRGEIAGIFWTPATKTDGTAIVAEDYIDYSGERYFVFQNAHRTERYSYFALKAT